MLGGAAPPDDVPDNAVVTYGMTETGSGIVYDGVPLDGVDVRIADDGEVQVAARLLRAYRGAMRTSTRAPTVGSATGDLGRWLPDGRLHVDGRAHRPDHQRR